MGISLSLSIRCKREANSAFLATKKHLLAVTGLGHCDALLFLFHEVPLHRHC